MKRSLIIAAAMAAAFSSCFAADATFSKDCRHVYLVVAKSGEKLADIDLAAKSWRLTETDLPTVKGVTLTNAGLILCACAHSIWSFDPSTGKCAKVCDAPQGVTLKDIAYDPRTEVILTVGDPGDKDTYDAGGEPSAYGLVKGCKELAKVWIRYGAQVGHPVFTADGTLFFESMGDLWMGFVSDENADVNDPGLGLEAYRCAPLASLIETNADDSSTGINDLAISSGFIYARYVRMGGSGWGDTLRFLRPQPLPGSHNSNLPDSGDPDWKGLARRFASVEYVNQLPFKFLCASRDGSLVFYAVPYHYREHVDQDEVFLVKHDGKPIPIEIKDLGDCWRAAR